MVQKAVSNADRQGVAPEHMEKVVIPASLLEAEVEHRGPREAGPGDREPPREGHEPPARLDRQLQRQEAGRDQTDAERADKNPYNTYAKGSAGRADRQPRREGDPGGAAPADGPWFYLVTTNLSTGETKFAVTRTTTRRTSRSSTPGARRQGQVLTTRTTGADGCGPPSGAHPSRTRSRPCCTRPPTWRSAWTAWSYTRVRWTRTRGSIRRCARPGVARALADDAAQGGRLRRGDQRRRARAQARPTRWSGGSRAAGAPTTPTSSECSGRWPRSASSTPSGRSSWGRGPPPGRSSRRSSPSAPRGWTSWCAERSAAPPWSRRRRPGSSLHAATSATGPGGVDVIVSTVPGGPLRGRGHPPAGPRCGPRRRLRHAQRVHGAGT